MYIPEYTITNRILAHIATVEYAKAVADTKVILPSWEKNLQKEADAKFLKDNLNLLGIHIDLQEIKKYLDGISKTPSEIIVSLKKSIDSTQILAQGLEIDEKDLSNLYKDLQNTQDQNLSVYRQNKIENATSPEEILAEMIELTDWLNSIDGQETHPLIKAGIVKAKITEIQPYQTHNELMGNLFAYQILKSGQYTLRGFLHPEMSYCNDPAGYKAAKKTILQEEKDLTEWISFYLETIAAEASTKKEQILLLSKDTKIAQASGRAKLSKRQERIVGYLQDYGILQNKDFGRIFPDISEDTVLRELKKLIKKDIVIKRGKTKSSRYELK